MPTALTFPGVYIEEVASGVRTITGVATSITAFIGRALRGPTDQDEVNSPVSINSFGEFERIFGGLWADSTLGFAVRDFFLNGGSRAIVVRIYKDGKGAKGKKPAKFVADTLTLQAASPGAWGGKLRVRIDYDTLAPTSGKPDTSIFNLIVKDTQTGQIELFRNMSVEAAHPRRVDKVLEHESTLLRVDVDGPAPASRPKKNEDIAPKDVQDPFSDLFPKRYTVASAPLPTDGVPLTEADISFSGLEATKTGMYALLRADLFNLLCIPPHTPSSDPNPTTLESTLLNEAATFCKQHRAFLIVDPPYTDGVNVAIAKTSIKDFRANELPKTNYAAVYFPTLIQPNPLHDGQFEEFAPCGAVAGVMARTDAERGVWKAPAGQDATLVGVPQLSVSLADADNGELNPLGVNCLRAFPAIGRVVWGARTIEGDDRLASEWKYIPVRRFALFLEESLYRGTQWVVFEPNDEPLWAQIRLNIGAFMQNLFRQGAFQGKSPREAYFVKCDGETTTQTDINLGIVNIHVGFAPLKPAEFVVIQIQQMAGQIAV